MPLLTSTKKLTILERYFTDVSNQIKVGDSNHRGTGKFIGYLIKSISQTTESEFRIMILRE